MKPYIWITLFALVAETYAAAVVPVSPSPAQLLRKSDGTSSLKKTGETMESLGKILQGQATLLTPEQLDTVLNAVKELDSEEYGFLLILITAAVGAAVSSAVGAGVSHALNHG